MFIFEEAVEIVHLKATVLEHASRRQFPSLIVLWDLKLSHGGAKHALHRRPAKGEKKNREPSRLTTVPRLGLDPHPHPLHTCHENHC